MKSFFKLFLLPFLILNFLFFPFLNKKSELNENYLDYQNQEINNYSEYSENSISSQQFIDDLESIPKYGTYELQSNVDFSDSKNDDVTGLELDSIRIQGNGYTLYDRDVTEIFNTTTFEVSEENGGLTYYSFFKEVDECYIYNLNFDNFMFPFGITYDSWFENLNFYNLDYQNLIFNVRSANIKDDYSYQLDDVIVNIATIGLIFQDITGLNGNYLYNCCFENINFSNNTIILFDQNISTVVSLIGGIETLGSFPNAISVYFRNIYINNIIFSNNQFISGIDNNSFTKINSEQEKYFSIFYNPFIGSATNIFHIDEQYQTNASLSEIIFNDINIYGNSNNFANYTFYSLLPSISTGVTFFGKNIYGFNLNLDIETESDNGENISIGSLSNDVYYPPLDFYYTGIYQSDLINDDVYYRYIPLDYSFSDNTSMIEQMYLDNYQVSNYNEWWYYDKLSTDQDYSLVLAGKPTIVYFSDSYYDQDEETLDFSFRLIDGRYKEPSEFDPNQYYSNYTISLIDRNNDEIIWSQYVEYPSERGANKFKISIDSELLFENNLYFEISNDYHFWEQDVNFRKYLPEIYNVSNVVEDNNLMVSYDFIDPYNLINSINISLYDNLNNQIENKTIDYNNIENDYLNSEQIIFDTEIDDPNNYYLKIEVNCNLYEFNDPNIVIKTLDDNLIQYSENSDILFRTEAILPPSDDKSLSLWAIILIILFSLILITLFIFSIYFFMIKKKKN
ncbi:/ / hypothetical protein / 592641:594827 Reverse [Candidatus Hepatoplasma crinochetorum]|uniref:Uncharacterized protein n=1 Tax=Candidatus Hepatoplasma crinochetorum TaxID=295596 RepID=A0A0G7ZLS2_9MOLU|nr:/ / hypothetical protein / 592641:594827 Reverse [Candidatus Hepatoplasma crinochetorum]